MVLEAGSPRTGASMVGGGPLSHIAASPFSVCFHMVDGARELSGATFIKH